MVINQAHTKWIVLGLLLGLFMAALDQTIVSTAMPTIVGEFGAYNKLVWVFSAYMIASVIATPIFGKLSDMYGRKRFFLLGLGVFLLGSILCGMATSMDQLIIYRAMQGIGGGAIMPLCFAVIFDIFPPEKRGKMNGLFGAVFGLSSVFGPLVGAYFTDYIDWRWIFYINVPIGIVSVTLLMVFFREVGDKRKQSIDWGGAVLLAATILCLMFALEMGGRNYAWDSWQILGLFAAFLVGLALFLLVESRVANPIVALHLFRNKVFTASQFSSFLYGAIMISGATYIPIFVTGVYGGSASDAGQTLMPMMLGVVASSVLGGRFVGKFMYRSIMLVSVTILLVSLALLGTINVDTARWVVTLYMVCVGLGIGVSFVVFNLATLHKVSPQFKGAATSMIVFFRTIGSALGVTIFGVIQIGRYQDNIASALQDPAQQAQFSDPQALLQSGVRDALPPELQQQLVTGLAESVAYIFQWTIVLAAVALLLILLLGKANVEPSEGERPAMSFE
ncbi:MFS transporter [Paenibacillus sp. 598K]|uniref:MDR family MFS transporter n=1 Tax=Paenibacillus sp. 598K TaxID=1117987 RepID=UPI000FF9D5D6|nr:MDR family MFS transporter [Paenibacillus sp. 598K]GBF74925.1 MFS transporter [Paenibacillus sp. 598K]